MSDASPPTTLFAAILVGGIPLLMGGAAFYFTSGVILKCERSATGHASCTESRRILRLIDIPLHQYPVVVGAAFDERRAYDEDGEPYTARTPVVLTPAGREPLAPFGSGADLAGAVERLDAFAKNPEPGGLSVGGQAGGLSLFFHVFSSLFILLGVSNFAGYLRSLIGRPRRRRGAPDGQAGHEPTPDSEWRL